MRPDSYFPSTAASITCWWNRWRSPSRCPLRDSPGPADCAHLAAVAAAAEEPVAAVGLQARHGHAGRHIEPFQDLSGSRIDPSHVALVTFPGAVPELVVDPGDPGDEAAALDSAQNGARLRIDLMNPAVPILPHPERPFGPGEAGITAAAGRRNRREHMAGIGIDLLDAILGDLEQVLAIEGRSCMRGDIDRAQRVPAHGIEGVQSVAGGDPDGLTIICDPTDAVDARKGPIFTADFGCGSLHVSISQNNSRNRIPVFGRITFTPKNLVARQWTRE